MVFLGREIAQHRDYSEETARLIDSEVKKIVTFAFDRALSILQENNDALHRLADALLEREILDREEIALILEGKTLPSEEEAEEAKKRKKAEKAREVEAPTAPVEAMLAIDARPETADRTNGRHATGEQPSHAPEPAARAEDGAPGEA
jgi:thioredoxin-like negative regulator of GroEL